MSPFRVVLLTPAGRGAVGTLLVEGDDAMTAVEGFFRAPSGRTLASHPVDRPVFGHLLYGQPPGEEVVVRRRAENSVEIHSHGGRAVTEAIMGALLARGGKQVSWQAWAAGQHPDPITAAACVALAEARTERTAAILLDQHRGALRRAIEAIERLIQRGELGAALAEIETLLARSRLGLHLVAPWRVVLSGRTNVGKSSLINALVGYARAIVDPTPGTTRDVVTATTAVDGWPIELSDTAGLGEEMGTGAIEQAGIELARRKLAEADLVILVFDSSRPWSDDDAALLAQYPDALVVHNKADLPQAFEPVRPWGLYTSSLNGYGTEALVRAIASRLVSSPPPPGAAVPFTTDQIELVRSVLGGDCGGHST